MPPGHAWDRLWTGVNLATMEGDGLGIVRGGALAVAGSRIVWVGPEAALPGAPQDLAEEVIERDGAWLLPGFIDCHTHLVFGGDRSDEFRRRLHGETYREIAESGGGIMSTVRATRNAGLEDLVRGAVRRADDLSAWGVTTVEVKSGYGLEVAAELRMLQAARAVAEHVPVDVETTLLAAHAVPPDAQGGREAYLSLVINEMIPAAAEAGLASAVDAFCESIAFSPDECRRVLEAGAAFGLAGRLHADQLSDLDGGALAASVGARSADHLEFASEASVIAMAEAGVAAVLLPGAYYSLQEERRPPVEAFRRHGVPMALATDANPGSSPITCVGAVLNMGCVLFGLTPEEALRPVGFSKPWEKVKAKLSISHDCFV